jgi:hypothetical protein
MNVLMIVNGPPYGSELPFNALRLAPRWPLVRPRSRSARPWRGWRGIAVEGAEDEGQRASADDRRGSAEPAICRAPRLSDGSREHCEPTYDRQDADGDDQMDGHPARGVGQGQT